MASIRQQQVASIIKQSISDIFIKKGRDFYSNAFVTLTQVRVTPDLLIARIYVSVFNIKEKKDVIDMINGNVWSIRNLLGRKIRHKVRRIPDLEFYLDDTLDDVYKMEVIFDKLREGREERGLSEEIESDDD
ncbi:MAG: 30S ribosome-binding factor RbfA [Chitinophagales bacterium]